MITTIAQHFAKLKVSTNQPLHALYRPQSPQGPSPCHRSCRGSNRSTPSSVMSNHNDPGNDGKDPTNNDVCQAYVYDLVDIAKPLLVLSSRTDHLAINIIPLSESSRGSNYCQSCQPVLFSQQLINSGCCHYWSPCHPCQPQSCPTWAERQMFHTKKLENP